MRGYLRLLIFVVTAQALSGCSSLLYHPTKISHVDPKELKPTPAETYVETAPTVQLHSWYFKAPANTEKKIVLVQFHGNAQNLSSHFYSLYWLVEKGFDVFTFDYRGYGKSGGESASPENTVSDGVEIIKYVCEKFPNERIFIYGQSLGGAVAARAVMESPNRNKIAGLILEGSFSSYKRVARRILAKSAWTWIFQPLAYVTLSDEFAPEGHWSRLGTMPILVMHGEKDPVIPFELGVDAFEKAPAWNKTFLRIENGGHVDLYSKDRKAARNQLTKWIVTTAHKKGS